MDNQQSQELLASGRDAWNAWARKMLDQRRALKLAGTWVDAENEWNKETRTWHSDATVDFCGSTITFHGGLTGLIFPGLALFNNTRIDGIAEFSGAMFEGVAFFNSTRFTGDVSFNGAVFFAGSQFKHTEFRAIAGFRDTTFVGEADFRGASFGSQAIFTKVCFKKSVCFTESRFKSLVEFDATKFEDDAEFDQVNFDGNAKFDAAQFLESGRFSWATFASNATFKRTTFSSKNGTRKWAWFNDVRFGGIARFDKSSFVGDAHFERAVFNSAAWVADAHFLREASFLQTVFAGYTTFDRTKFSHLALFRAVEAKTVFSLAATRFQSVPDFVQSHFVEAPRLDDLHIFSPRSNNRANDNLDLAARWRALKRLAIQGHDHVREQAFFKGELIARRLNEDKPWHAVFWFGVFYQTFSDFGRSLLRPILWLFLSTFFFAGLYLNHHPVLREARASSFIWGIQQIANSKEETLLLECVAGTGDPWKSALWLSADKAAIFPGLVPDNKLDNSYACIFGAHFTDSTDSTEPIEPLESFSPIVPDKVVALGFIQRPLSAVWVFLFLLAIRNHFRIR